MIAEAQGNLGWVAKVGEDEHPVVDCSDGAIDSVLPSNHLLRRFSPERGKSGNLWASPLKAHGFPGDFAGPSLDCRAVHEASPILLFLSPSLVVIPG